ncbi:MAG: hypothetical protein ACI4KR_07005 [Ruminiclostridium sp.]
MTDEWNGFAYLLANLIEKYAAKITFDDLPTFHEVDTAKNKNDCINEELSIDNSYKE